MKKYRAARLVGLCLTLPTMLSVVGCGEKKRENKVILGNITELSGDFRFSAFEGSNPGAADLDVFSLTNGYSTMETDKNGTYHWNGTVVKSHTEEEIAGADGSTDYKLTIELKEGLKLSDGSPVTADNYLAYILACSSVVATQAGSPAMAGQAYVGYDAFRAYDGKNEGAGATRIFSGVRKEGERKFSLTIDGPDYYPYYYVDIYGGVSCYPVTAVLGEDVEIKDDGQGCYLSNNWYASESKTEGGKQVTTYHKAAHLNSARYDTSSYPYSGPYKLAEWDKTTNTATLKINEYYEGNFEGQKPRIETVVYTKVVSETQFDQLKSGAVDVLAGLTGGDDVNKGLSLVKEGGYKETHYDRAGYGKIQFECDFGPTMFAEVRRAVSYLLNKNEFASTFTGGYGSLVYGPYSRNLDVFKTAGGKDFEESLNKYEFSTGSAKQSLIDGGWVYRADGSAYDEAAGGISYKKLSSAEATKENIAYKGVTSEGAAYRTVKVGNDYYMPLVINWFCTENNPVSDLLTTYYVGSNNLSGVGMLVTKTVGSFTQLMGEIYRSTAYGYSGTPTYGMLNLATGFTSEIYDYSYNWSVDPAYFGYSACKLFDPYDYTFAYKDHSGLDYDAAVESGGNKLGMDYLSMGMVYSAQKGNKEEFAKWWKAYITRWNSLVPEIPLYSNIYYDVYNAKLKGMETTPFRGVAETVLYCSVG